MHKIIFVTGASGSGKTTILKEYEKKSPESLTFCYFDSIGVPSSEDMIRDFGSGDEWQRQTTERWVSDIKDKYLHQTDVMLDGQMRISFILDACKKNQVNSFMIILFDCNDKERKARLTRRGDHELATEDMMSWAKYLRNEVTKLEEATILDTTDLSIAQSVERLSSFVTK